jgi:hypothetical protein
VASCGGLDEIATRTNDAGTAALGSGVRVKSIWRRG